MAGPIRIAILANGRQARAEIDATRTRAQRMGSLVSKAGKVAALGLAGVGFAAIKAGKAAAEDEAAQSRLAQTLRTAARASRGQISATEAWITAQGKAKGVADDELRPAIARLVVATGSIEKAQARAALAMDISASTGKSLEQVSSALAKAETGRLTGLAGLGVRTKDAAGQTRSLSAITSELAQKYRGASAKAADTAAGRQKRLTVQLGELQEQIGAKLLPVMNKLASAGLKAVEWASKNEGKVKAFGAVVLAVAGIMVAASVAQKAYTAALMVFRGVAIAIRSAIVAWQIAQIALNLAMMLNPIGVVVIAIAALVAAIVIAWKKSDTFRKIVTGAFNAVKNGVTKAVSAVVAFVKRNWPLLLAIITGPIGLVVLAVIKNWDRIKQATSRAWGAVKDTVRNAVGKVVEFATGIKDKVIGAFANAGEWLRDAGRKIITGLINGIKDKFDAVKNTLGDLTSKLTDWKGPAAVDKRLLFRPGQLIIGGLVKGMKQQIPEVRRTLTALTSDIGGFAAQPLTTELALAGGPGGSGRVQATLRVTAEMLTQLQRGQAIQADLDFYRSIGGREAASA